MRPPSYQSSWQGRIGRILLFFSTILVLPACEKLDPKEKTPAFIRIEDPKVVTDPLTEGSGSHDIRYAWVYVGDSLEGAYELPATVYTPKTGERNIKISAGIQKNGMLRDKIRYPFYQRYSTERRLKPDDSVHIEPRFQYFDQAFITIWDEDFDDPNEQNVTARPASDASLDIVQDPSKTYEGNGSGIVHLDQSQSFFLGASEGDFQFETGNAVFLELNYKSRDTINVGLLAEYPQQNFKRSLLNLTATKGDDGKLRWNKIYVDLTPLVNEEPNALSYEVFIESRLRGGADQSDILIDNFKVLYQD